MNEAILTNRRANWRARIVDYLSLERNVAIASAAVFLIGFGEELWKKFVPKYLEVLGATTPVIGLFGTVEDFFDAIYQYAGGFIADHLGRRRDFLIFITLASLGYFVYLIMITSILVYLPAGKIADRVGRKPFVILTFLSFALFPVAIVGASSFTLMVVAFVIGGLREIGEPSRKSDDRGLCRGQYPREVSWPLLPCTQSVDHTCSTGRRVVVESCPTGAVCHCRGHRAGWHFGLRLNC